MNMMWSWKGFAVTWEEDGMGGASDRQKTKERRSALVRFANLEKPLYFTRMDYSATPRLLPRLHL